MNAILKLELLKNKQDKGLIFWTLILPIIFTVLFISIFTAGTEGVVKKEIITSIVPGYTIMFVFFIIISMANSFVNDKDSGFVSRLASTPLSPFQYITGKWIAYFIIVIIQIIILQAFGKLVYTVPMEQPIQLGMIAIALTFCTTGIGLAISILIRTNNMGIAITQILALGGALIGGLWVPLEIMPDFFQNIAYVTPQYWAHSAFQMAMEGSITLSDLLETTSVLIGFGCLGLIIAILSYPRFLRHAKN